MKILISVFVLLLASSPALFGQSDIADFSKPVLEAPWGSMHITLASSPEDAGEASAMPEGSSAKSAPWRLIEAASREDLNTFRSKYPEAAASLEQAYQERYHEKIKQETEQVQSSVTSLFYGTSAVLVGLLVLGAFLVMRLKAQQQRLNALLVELEELKS